MKYVAFLGMIGIVISVQLLFFSNREGREFGQRLALVSTAITIVSLILSSVE